MMAKYNPHFNPYPSVVSI